MSCVSVWKSLAAGQAAIFCVDGVWTTFASVAYGTALRVENSKVDSAVITALECALMSVEGVNADSAPIAALRQRSDERATASV